MPQKPLVLLASTERSQLRTLEPELPRHGFAVQAVNDPRVLVQHAQQDGPHAIVLDFGVAPPQPRGGYALARTLRNDPAVSRATAIVLTGPGPGPPTRTQLVDAWRAGAWDVRTEPFDPDEFAARLSVFVQARIELDRVSAECLVDRASGLYNPEGLARRSAELAALVSRHGLALACAVFRPTDGVPHTNGDRLAVAFQRTARLSDAVGRTGPTEFAIFAPGTNATSASRLVRRMSDTIRRKFRSLTLRAAYSTAQAPQKIPTRTLLANARSALDNAP